MGFVMGLFIGCIIGVVAVCLCKRSDWDSCESYMPEPIEVEEIRQ